MEYELEPTFAKQDDGMILMQKGVLRLTQAQYDALQPAYGEAFMYDEDGWTQVCDMEEGMCGSLYQNVNLPEGPVQIELREDGTVVKHPLGDDARLAKRIMAILPTLTSDIAEDLLQRLVLVERILKEALE